MLNGLILCGFHHEKGPQVIVQYPHLILETIGLNFSEISEFCIPKPSFANLFNSLYERSEFQANRRFSHYGPSISPQ